MKAKPLIPYMRKSSGEDPEGSSERQRGAIRAWAKRNEVPLADEVWEPHVSGKKDWRERGLGEAIAACERGEVGGIVVEEQSRLSRENGLATAEVWQALEKAGARLVCAAEGLDTATGDQELNFAIKAALAREQWKQYARRTEAAKKRAVEEEGLFIGPVPFGYVRPAPHLPLRLDRRKANAVRAAFELRASGASYGDVTRLLDKRSPGGPSGGGAWHRGTVTRLLSNRVYLGEARGGGYVKVDAHPAIIDLETFDAVQALARHGRREPVKREGANLLAGVARCGSCGYALDRNVVAKHYLVYRCRGRSARGLCEAPTSAMAHALEQFVSDHVLEALAGYTVEKKRVELDVSAIHERLAKARRKRAPFEDPDYVEQIGQEAASRAVAKVNGEIAALEAELAEAIGSPTDISPSEARRVIEIWPTLSTDARREVVSAMIDSVLVSRGTRGALRDRVSIYWHGDEVPLPRPTRGRNGNERAN